MVAVPSKNIGQLGLGFRFLGMHVLIGIMSEFLAGDIAYIVFLQYWQATFLLCSQLLYYNNRTMKGANNSPSQYYGNVKNADFLVYA